jgi:hypothetical protein
VNYSELFGVISAVLALEDVMMEARNLMSQSPLLTPKRHLLRGEKKKPGAAWHI